jgi:hypothetical protein
MNATKLELLFYCPQNSNATTRKPPTNIHHQSNSITPKKYSTMTDKLTSLGQERLKSDTRQLAGFLMLVSTCALIFPMADIASLVGPNGTTASEGIGLSALIASILVVIMGILGIVVGYLQAIHDYGHKYLTGFFLVFIQLAWMVSSQRKAQKSIFAPMLNGSAYDHPFSLCPCHDTAIHHQLDRRRAWRAQWGCLHSG